MDPPMDFPRSLVDVAEPSRDGLLRERAYIGLKKLILTRISHHMG
jgi:hypothetical protein